MSHQIDLENSVGGGTQQDSRRRENEISSVVQRTVLILKGVRETHSVYMSMKCERGRDGEKSAGFFCFLFLDSLRKTKKTNGHGYTPARDNLYIYLLSIYEIFISLSWFDLSSGSFLFDELTNQSEREREREREESAGFLFSFGFFWFR